MLLHSNQSCYIYLTLTDGTFMFYRQYLLLAQNFILKYIKGWKSLD